MADAVCQSCGVSYRPCGSCGSSNIICKSCKRAEVIVKKRAELTDGQCLYYVGDNLAGVYTIEQAERMLKVHVNGRIERKGDI